MDKRLDRGQSTRRLILNTAVGLFAEHGYDATAIEFVMQAAGVSRGALYHHFTSKEAIFAAVLETVEERVASDVAAAAAGAANPLDALRAGAAAWLALANDPIVRRIVLIDAPAVVGWQAWRAMEDRYALGLLKSALATAAASGRLPAATVDTVAHVLLASLIELSLLIARDPDDRAVATAAHDVVEKLVSLSLGVPPYGSWDTNAAALPAPKPTRTSRR